MARDRSEHSHAGAEGATGETTVGGGGKSGAIGEVSATVEAGYVGLTGGIDVDAVKELATAFATAAGDLFNRISGVDQIKKMDNGDVNMPQTSAQQPVEKHQ